MARHGSLQEECDRQKHTHTQHKVHRGLKELKQAWKGQGTERVRSANNMRGDKKEIRREKVRESKRQVGPLGRSESSVSKTMRGK